MSEKISGEIADIKDLKTRQFQTFTNNFYLLKAAIRYFTVKKQLSFTANKISENFPLTIPAAGSGLSILKELEVVEPRTRSNSPDRYLPDQVDMERLSLVERVLLENYEINKFYN